MGGGYKNWPHRFTGRALYQLNLVKVSEARKHVPADLPLVELFGYTLGGLYLARYDDSPVGAFDEMVALGGLVWNPPTSCAWATRVYVNNAEARRHGVQEVGLPSHVATFREVEPAAAASSGGGGGAAPGPKRPFRSWWRHKKAPASGGRAAASEAAAAGSDPSTLALTVASADVCRIAMPPPAPSGSFVGPRISLKLPSFSGRSPSQPNLLRYALDLNATVRLSAPARVAAEPQLQQGKAAGAAAALQQQHPLAGILGGRPLLTLAFDDMDMLVGKPVVVGAAAQQQQADAKKKLAVGA